MPHTLRILAGPSFWPLPGQLTQLVHAGLAASPHRATRSQKTALLPIKAKSVAVCWSVGLGAALMKSGHKVRSLPDLPRLLASSLIQPAIGWSASEVHHYQLLPSSQPFVFRQHMSCLVAVWHRSEHWELDT